MLVKRITKISNPRRRRAVARKRSNPKKRLSPKQIKFFGSKAQRAALKRKRSNPKPRRMKTVSRRRPAARNIRRRRPAAKNPAHLLTFAAGVNPSPRKKRRITKMAVTKKRRRVRPTAAVNPKRRRRRTIKTNAHRRRRVMKASNPHRRRRRNTRVIVKNSHRRRSVRRSGNPSLFGQSNSFEIGKMIVGGLAGVTITKAVPNMLPSSMTSSPIMRTGSSIVIALLTGYLGGKFVDKTLGDAMMFGGLMQAFSVGLNSFLPSVGATIGLQGLGGGIGDLVAGNYPVPQNPLWPQYNPAMGGGAMAALPAGHPAKMAGPSVSSAPTTAGVNGIFGNAWGSAN
jgi:hypothetical protein